MTTYMFPVARNVARMFRTAFIVCVLFTLLLMQASVLKHPFEHFGTTVSNAASFVMHFPSQTQSKPQVAEDASQNDSPGAVSCQKCLEDVAHAFVLPDSVLVSHIDLAYVMARTSLPHNLPFLSPERANQRGPPLAV